MKIDNPAQDGIVAAKMDAVRALLKEIEGAIEGHLIDDDENTLTTEQLVASALEVVQDFERI